MSSGLKRHSFILVILVLLITALTMVSALKYSGYEPSVTATAAEGDATAVIAHMTDIHYFPTYYCYNGQLADTDYSSGAALDTKLMAESSDVLRKSLQDLLIKKPDYLVISGDISSNAERRGVIDVANALRRLQNDLRANGKPDFQVFVVPGNHDLYNHRAIKYNSNGNKEIVATVSSKDFSIIFAGLGFPDITIEEADAFYTDEEWNFSANNNLPYDPVNPLVNYVESTNSAKFTYSYKFMDTYADYKTRQDYSVGDLTYTATGANYSFIGLDAVKSTSLGGLNYNTHMFPNKPEDGEGHITGGFVTDAVYKWLDTKEAIFNNSTIISVSHHNLLPHFGKEENYVTDFVLDYWEDTAEYLCNYANGVRYHFSGHMHANDVAMYASFSNNVIYDFETSSIISYCPSIRYATIARSTVNGKIAEKSSTQVVNVTNVSFEFLFTHGYLSMDLIEDSASLVKPAFANLANKYVCSDLSEYINISRYKYIVQRILSQYLVPGTVNMLTGMIDNMNLSVLDKYKPDIKIIINNLVSQVNTKILADYTYSGTNKDYLPGGQYAGDKLFAYALELVEKIAFDSLVTVSENEKYSLVDIVMTALLSHTNGNEKTALKDLPQWQQEAINKLNNGEIVGFLLDNLLDKEKGLYPLLINLINTELDLSANVNAGNKKLIESALKMLLKDNSITVDLSKLRIADYVVPVIKLLKLDIDIGDNIVAFLDDFINKYYTESFKTGLGGIAGDIVTSMLIDNYADGAVGTVKDIRYKAGEVYTYTGVPRTDIPATVENGRLPAKLSVTFGDNPKNSKNFVYFTDKSIAETDIQFIKFSSYNATQPFETQTVIKKTGVTELYAYSFPLFDLGLFSTYRTKITARHSISLTGLEEGTQYVYRVGSEALKFWSPVYTFKTAPGNNAPFEVLLISDVQGFVNKTYKDANSVLTGAINSFSSSGYSFIINCGDSVDNGQNSAQWGYALDSLRDIYANNTQVVTAGNHEDNYFEDKNFAPEASMNVKTNPYNSLALYYNFPNVPAQTESELSGIYYSFDYSNVHFTVLNTNDIKDNHLGDVQTQWLINDLKNTDKTYKIVIMHKGLYTAGAHSYDADVIGLRAQLTPIFSDNNVSLVLQGHDHIYSESYYIGRDGKVIETNKIGKSKLGNPDGGVLYVTLGTLGDKYYSYVENENVPVYYGKDLHTGADNTLTNPTYGKLVFDGNDLYYQGYQYNLTNGTVETLTHKDGSDYDRLIKLFIGLGIGGGVLIIGLSSVFISIHIRKKNYLKQTQSDSKDDINVEVNVIENTENKDDNKQ